MTKADLITTVTNNIGFPEKESHNIVDLFLEIMVSTLESGETVKISGFGTWTVREKKARNGRNPQTGDAIVLDERRVVKFKASPVLKGRVEGSRVI
jgi:integration host factor subunit alpha